MINQNTLWAYPIAESDPNLPAMHLRVTLTPNNPNDGIKHEWLVPTHRLGEVYNALHETWLAGGDMSETIAKLHVLGWDSKQTDLREKFLAQEEYDRIKREAESEIYMKQLKLLTSMYE